MTRFRRRTYAKPVPCSDVQQRKPPPMGLKTWDAWNPDIQSPRRRRPCLLTSIRPIHTFSDLLLQAPHYDGTVSSASPGRLDEGALDLEREWLIVE